MQVFHATVDDLIAGCKKGDRSCQNALYKTFSSKMMTVCYRYARNKEDAQDTLMEGFMKVFEKIDHFRGEGSFEGWMRKIMVNTALTKYKQKSTTPVIISFENRHSTISSEDDILSELGAKQLMELIQKLPPAYQMVFNLYSFEGMKHREIAELLGISEGTSKSNLSDARKILQTAVQRLQPFKIAINE